MLGRARNLTTTAKIAAARTKPTKPQPLWHQMGWGCAAAAALSVAILSGQSDAGAQRVSQVLAFFNAQPAPPTTHRFDAETATRQLAAAVRGLGEDRDRLVTRLAAVERDMDDMTGSIKHQIETVKAAATAQPATAWPLDAPPVPMTPADVATMVKSLGPAPSRPATAAADSPPAEPAASPPPTYGADIGTALSMKALQLRWTGLRTAHPELFQGLRPLVSLRDNPRTNHAELHLVVGPYPNADGAAQLCFALSALHMPCQPTMFDGSRLALQ